jgi:hypothetical protein
MIRAARRAPAALAVLLLATTSASAERDGGLVEKYVKIMESISADADANKPDCEKIGIALAKHQAKDAAIMKQLKADRDKLSPQERKAVLELIRDKYGARLKASEAKAAPIKACTANAKIKAYANEVMR